MKAPFLLGRLLFGGFFLYNGINHFRHHQPLSQYAASKNVPAPGVGVAASGIALMVGGASIILGIRPKLGSLAIIGFLAGVSPVMHDFWKVEDPAQRQHEMINFGKNIALLGGAMALMAVEEPWAASIPIAQPDVMKRSHRSGRQRIAA